MTAILLADPPKVAGTTGSTSPRRYAPAVRRFLVGALAFFVLPNLAVLGAHLLAQRSAASSQLDLPIKNFTQVDDRLWRGAAPGLDGYRALAANGVTTVIDLRAEEDLQVDEALMANLGLTRVALPLRDGQSPSAELVARFLQTVEDSPGRAFVHCGAGVGRTGTMAAAYLVKSGQASPGTALRRNLSVGPPSLEQMAFSAGLGAGEVKRPDSLLVALSRTLDAPRRIWVGLRN